MLCDPQNVGNALEISPQCLMATTRRLQQLHRYYMAILQALRITRLVRPSLCVRHSVCPVRAPNSKSKRRRKKMVQMFPTAGTTCVLMFSSKGPKSRSRDVKQFGKMTYI